MTDDRETSTKVDPAPATEVYVDPQPAPAPRTGGNRAPLVVASVALAAALTTPYWSGPLYRALHLRPPALEWQARQEVETGRLNQSLAELDRRIAELGRIVAKANDESGAVRAVQGAVEAQLRALTLLQMRDILRRPVPFEAELKAVRAIVGKVGDLDPLLATVEPYAATGIPLASQLRWEFSSVAEAVARTEPRASMLKWLGSFAVWPVGTAAPDPDARPERPVAVAVADRAQGHLADNDLRGAVEELSTLEGDAAAAARTWLGQAQARLAANRAADRIAEYVSSSLGRSPARP